MKWLVIALVDFYRIFLSFDRGILSILAPGGACKYTTPCSLYAKKMVLRHGVAKGVFLGLRRVLSCR